MTTVYVITFAMLAFGAVCVVLRTLLGPTTLDRVLGLDVFALILVAGIAINGAVRGSNEQMAILAAVALLGFTSAVSASRLAGRHD